MDGNGPTRRRDFWVVPNNDQQQVKKYDPFCCKAIAHVLGVDLEAVTVTTLDVDRSEAADFVVLAAGPKRIACRIRRHEFLLKYPRQFTIRESRPTGAPTELGKILGGLGDYLLYGFANPQETTVISFFLADLNVFRREARWRASNNLPFGFTKSNTDGSGDFKVFNLSDFPVGFLVEWKKVNKAGTGWDHLIRTWKDDRDDWIPYDDTMLLPGEKPSY